eukprot:Nk52_evm32s359 gene=Nk52_evmTU32s359
MKKRNRKAGGQQSVESNVSYLEEDLRILTYNVNWGLCRVPVETQKTGGVCRAIRKSQACIVCLQETHPGWEEFLTEKVGDLYPYRNFKHHINTSATRHDVDGSHAGGMAILSRFPFKDVFYGQPSVEGSFFPLHIVAIELPHGEVLHCINMHLRPPISHEQKFSVRAYFSTSGVRKEEIQFALSKLGPGTTKVIVCGDFNEGHDASAVQWLRRGKYKSHLPALADFRMRDALYDFNPDAKTWFWPLKFGLTLKGAYDHIFYSSKYIECMECNVLSEYDLLSDHSPVLGVFRVRLKAVCKASAPDMSKNSGRYSLDLFELEKPVDAVGSSYRHSDGEFMYDDEEGIDEEDGVLVDGSSESGSMHSSSTTIVTCERKSRHRRWWSSSKNKGKQRECIASKSIEEESREFEFSVDDYEMLDADVCPARTSFINNHHGVYGMNDGNNKSQSVSEGLTCSPLVLDDLERRRSSLNRTSSNPCLTERETNQLNKSYEFIGPSSPVPNED